MIDRLGNLPADCLPADVTSVKAAPLEQYAGGTPGAGPRLHPMFGPDGEPRAKQVIVWLSGRRRQPVAAGSMRPSGGALQAGGRAHDGR